MQKRQELGKSKGIAGGDELQPVLSFYRQSDQQISLIGFGASPTGARQEQCGYQMHATLATLIDRLDSSAIARTQVIKWGCPVPSFGDLATSEVATLGLNPSNREFVDESGNELEGPSRRFHTLNSLGLTSWCDVDARHLRLILECCGMYFLRNPYDQWFRRLDYIVSGAGASFYDSSGNACHLDLIPYATARKWTELTGPERSALLSAASDTLALLLQNSPIRVLILNGRSVVEKFQDIAGVSLQCTEMPTWSLPRESQPVRGFAYSGTVDKLSGFRLPHEILVLGYNHNLQSSYGVTSVVVRAIRSWISRMVKREGDATARP